MSVSKLEFMHITRPLVVIDGQKNYAYVYRHWDSREDEDFLGTLVRDEETGKLSFRANDPSMVLSISEILEIAAWDIGQKP